MNVTRVPGDGVPTYRVESDTPVKLVELLVALGAAPNKAHARHLIEAGAVEIIAEGGSMRD